MKKQLLLLGFFLGNVGSAAIPSFLKEGDVYAFFLAGRANAAESSLAKVEKIDPSGWLEVSLVQKRERMWINLAQVQVVVPSKYDAATVRESLIRRKVADNLRTIAAKVDEFRIFQSKEPSTVREAFALPDGYIPLGVEDGEDYSSVDVTGDKPLKVITKSGYEIIYERKRANQAPEPTAPSRRGSP